MGRARFICAAAAIAALLFAGCGEAPYDLTEKEEGIIVNYSAHIVAKYNAFQKEGLQYVDLEELATEEDGPGTEAEAEGNTEDGQEASVDSADASGTGEGAEPAAQGATLQELFGTESLQISYVGTRLSSDYIEDEYYAVDADAGKEFLIVGIDVTNTGTEPVEIDFLSSLPQFTAQINGSETSTAETTLLTSDFSTLEVTLSGGETKEAVLLFQVPKSLGSVDSLSLLVGINGENYQVNLENM